MDEELVEITRQPLSILVSPLLCKDHRPHCPVPSSPVDSGDESTQSSTRSAPSPRRPLFTNRLVPMGGGHALMLFPSPSFSASTASTPSLSSPIERDDGLTLPVSRSLSTESTLLRTRSQWRRYLNGKEMREDNDVSHHSLPLLPPQRRITPQLIPDLIATPPPTPPTIPCKDELTVPSSIRIGDPRPCGVSPGRVQKRAASDAATHKPRTPWGKRAAKQTRIVEFFSMRD